MLLKRVIELIFNKQNNNNINKDKLIKKMYEKKDFLLYRFMSKFLLKD